ncbi:MAG: DnaD domain protein [Ruminococcaceae bacterium]|nr:DnaD domain protein [Oscillospiraceae bacterium]
MFNNNSVDGVFVMPKDVLKYINNAKKVELRLIMYIFAKGENFTVEDAAEDLSESVEMINSALSFWRGTGLITERDGKVKVKKERVVASSKEEPKQETYSTLDVANATMNDDEFRQIVKFVEKTLGDLPNASKQAQLYYLYDNLGMQSDVIMGIIAHCAAAGKTQMSYIKKTAEGIHNDGVETYKELETYLAAKEEYKNFETAVKRIIGAGDRAFTKSEKALVEKWDKEWNVSTELLSVAYERTIALISKPSLPYMSKILEGWYNEGIKTAQQAEELLEKQGQKLKKETADEKAEKARKAGFDFEFEDIFEKP